MAKRTSIHIFYSWQSDSPKKTNLNAIRAALARACKRIEVAYPNLDLVPDEATRDTSGSPNIALKILEKIEGAAVFLADVTTITLSARLAPAPIRMSDTSSGTRLRRSDGIVSSCCSTRSMVASPMIYPSTSSRTERALTG